MHGRATPPSKNLSHAGRGVCKGENSSNSQKIKITYPLPCEKIRGGRHCKKGSWFKKSYTLHEGHKLPQGRTAAEKIWRKCRPSGMVDCSGIASSPLPPHRLSVQSSKARKQNPAMATPLACIWRAV